MRQLKIVNLTGRPMDSRVVDADTGEVLPGVVDVVVKMEKDEAWFPRAIITVIGVQVEVVVGEAIIQQQEEDDDV